MTRFVVVATCLLALTMAGLVGAAEDRKVKITVLCDDTTASDQCLAEHGVSILVELPNGHRWLFDTGTTDVFMKNAKTLGVSLDNLTGIAISHGHNDHTGGLIFYPTLKGSPPVYGHPDIWAKQYEAKKGAPVRVIGMPDLARKFTYPVFKPVTGAAKLDDNLYHFSDVPREEGVYAPTQDKYFNEDGTGACSIRDDATLVVKTPRGLVAIFGCGHAGYVNILKAIHKQFPNEKLLAAMGGLHFIEADDKALADAIAITDKLKGKNFAFYGGHCTGKKAMEVLKAQYGDKVVMPLGSGKVLEF